MDASYFFTEEKLMTDTTKIIADLATTLAADPLTPLVIKKRSDILDRLLTPSASRTPHKSLDGVVYLYMKVQPGDVDLAAESMVTALNALHANFGIQGFLAELSTMDCDFATAETMVFCMPVVRPEDQEAAKAMLARLGYGQTYGEAKVYKRFPVLRIRNKTPGQIMTGSRAEITLDGKPLPWVRRFSFEVEARGVAKVTLEVFADVEIDAEVEVEEKVATDPEKCGEPCGEAGACCAK